MPSSDKVSHGFWKRNGPRIVPHPPVTLNRWCTKNGFATRKLDLFCLFRYWNPELSRRSSLSHFSNPPHLTWWKDQRCSSSKRVLWRFQRFWPLIWAGFVISRCHLLTSNQQPASALYYFIGIFFHFWWNVVSYYCQRQTVGGKLRNK